jgi:hypothetical protein
MIHAKWVSVKRRPPEHDTPVFCIDSDDVEHLLWYDDHSGFTGISREDEDREFDNITFWLDYLTPKFLGLQ